jgi:hypothetical protein
LWHYMVKPWFWRFLCLWHYMAILKIKCGWKAHNTLSKMLNTPIELYQASILSCNASSLGDTPPNSLMDSIVNFKSENNERIRSFGTLPRS